MSYRHFAPPSFATQGGQTVDMWMQWLESERVLHNTAPRLRDTCGLCLGPVGRRFEGDSWSHCRTCYQHGYALDGFVPISYSVDSGLESMLHKYKDWQGYDWLKRPLASILLNFWINHGSHVTSAMGGFDLVLPVPPDDQNRQFDHLRGMLDDVPAFHAQLPWAWGALTRDTQVPKPARNTVVSAAYKVSPELVRDRRVLLFDDLWTSGASMLSSAHKLREQGARSVFGMTLGRQLNLQSDYCNNQELVPAVVVRGGGGGCILCTPGI